MVLPCTWYILLLITRSLKPKTHPDSIPAPWGNHSGLLGRHLLSILHPAACPAAVGVAGSKENHSVATNRMQTRIQCVVEVLAKTNLMTRGRFFSRSDFCGFGVNVRRPRPWWHTIDLTRLAPNDNLAVRWRVGNDDGGWCCMYICRLCVDYTVGHARDDTSPRTNFFIFPFF